MTRHLFTDLATRRQCELLTQPGKPPRVIHPACGAYADVSVQFDAFYCPICRWNGRVSGAWVADMQEAEVLAAWPEEQ